MASQFPDVIGYYPDHEKLLREIIRVVKNMNQGRTNNASSVTLTANSATTVVSVPYNELGINTLVFFAPQTANAATEFGAGSLYVSARSISSEPTTSSTFTITHANNAQTDRTFGYILVG